MKRRFSEKEYLDLEFQHVETEEERKEREVQEEFDEQLDHWERWEEGENFDWLDEHCGSANGERMTLGDLLLEKERKKKAT